MTAVTQHSRAQMSRARSDDYYDSDEEEPSRKKAYKPMFYSRATVYRSFRNVKKTLLDGCASRNEWKTTSMMFNVRPNPEGDTPVACAMGTFFHRNICDVLFIGTAAESLGGSVDVISECLARKNPGIVTTDYKADGEKCIDLTFMLLDYTVTFSFDEQNVLSADFAEFQDLCAEYAGLCYALKLDPVLASTGPDPISLQSLRDEMQHQSRSAIDRPITGYDIAMAIRNDPFDWTAPEVARPVTVANIDQFDWVQPGLVLPEIYAAPFSIRTVDLAQSRNAIFSQDPCTLFEIQLEELRVRDYEARADSVQPPTQVPRRTDRNVHFSMNSVGNVRLSKIGLEMAQSARNFGNRAGFFNPQKVAQSIANGSLKPHDPNIPHKIWRNVDKILGTPDPSRIAGTMAVPRNVPTEEKTADLTRDEVVMEADFFIRDGRTFHFMITYPGGLVIGKNPSGKSGEEALHNFSSAINFNLSKNKKVVLITADSECGFGAIAEELMKQHQCAYKPLPRGKKPAGIERLNRTVGEHLDSYKHAAKHGKYPFAIAGILMTAAVFYIIMCINILSKRSNPGGVSPHYLWMGEPADGSKLLRHQLFDLVLCPSESIEATAEKSVYCLALGPSKPFLNSRTHSYLNLETFEILKRDDAVKVEMTEKVAAYINAQALDPKSPLYSKAMDKKFKKKAEKKAPGRPRKAPSLAPRPDPIFPTARDLALTTMQPTQEVAAEGPTAPASPQNDLLRHEQPPAVREDPVGNQEPLDYIHTPVALQRPPGTPERGEPSPLNRYFMRQELDGALDRVLPNGSVIYFSYPSHLNKYESHTAYIIDNVNFIHYSDIKSAPLLSHAAQVSLTKSLKMNPAETTLALADKEDGLLHRGVWAGVLRSSLSRTQMKKIIRSSCFIKQKFDTYGKATKWKARIVSDGSMQDKSLYSNEDISSPTVQLNSLLTLSAIAAVEGLRVKTMDIAQAYLNADMPTDVFVSLNKDIAKVVCERDPSFKEFLDDRGCLIVKLNKAQYGCVESARLWYNTLSALLESLGFVKNPCDPCVLMKSLDNGDKFYVAIYVDDIKAFTKSQEDLNWLQHQLEKSFGKVTAKDGDLHEYLGMRFDYSTPLQVNISMEQYIRDILKETGTHDTADSPALASLFEINEKSMLLDEPDREFLHRTVAQLLYAAVRCRPDILLPIIFLTSRVTKATRQDARKLKRVLAYLNGTAELGLTLGADRDGNLRVHTYADASYGVHPDGKSQSGIFISLGRGPVKCQAAKQKIVGKSSTEAELITLSDATSLAAYQLLFLESIGYPFRPAIMYQDNMSTMRLAENGRSNSDRTKHIKLRYFFIKQYLDSGEFELVHCPTDVMIADILTKPLQGDVFKRLRDQLLGITLA